jgi:hypothetical protein
MSAYALRVGLALHRDLPIFKDHGMRDALLILSRRRRSILPEVGVFDPAVQRVLGRMDKSFRSQEDHRRSL